MLKKDWLILGIALVLSGGLSWGEVGFNEHIRPILSDKCFACHGFDANKREADLRLDQREGALDVINLEIPEKSEMLERMLSHDPEEQMPPPETNKKITAADVALVTQWIKEGAKYESHWAYLSPESPKIPSDEKGSEIDFFVRRTLQEKGFEPAESAPKWRLVRRLYQDLVGLPPTTQEMRAGLAMSHEELVGHLLESPHYGERMAVPWLDLVRFADSVGYHGDQLAEVSPYRDYVIKAFNTNMRFDQFTREQLAGDLLPNPTEDQLVASGYNRLNMTSEEGGAQAKEYLAKYSGDRVRTTTTVWMGATVACAECHDHKFDPYTTKDFYSFAAFFADLEERGVYSARSRPPVLYMYTEEEKQQRVDLEKKIAEVKAQITKDMPKEHPLYAEHKKLLDQYNRIQSHAKQMLISKSVKPRTIRVLPRGNWMDDSGEIVLPAVPEFMKQIPLPEGQKRLSRLDLANWLISHDNPLTARVFVNRLWKQYFGSGISNVLEDLGNQGEWPTHPELLDWLARDFMESGWDIKRLVKTIVTSESYKQSSQPRSEVRHTDPYNRLLARQSNFRLDAEMVRDSALSVSGLLVRDIGGRSARPYQPPKYYQHLNFPRRTYHADQGEQQYRRGVYTHWQRTFLHPMMKSFDAPSREECAADRPRSNTPLQALVLLNDPTYVEAARVFAERIVKAEGGFGEKLDWAFMETLSREPSSAERAEMKSLFEKHHARFKDDAEAAKAYLASGEKAQAEGLNPTETATWMSLSRVLFNLHEMIARY